MNDVIPFDKNRRGLPTRKRVSGPVELTAQHRKLIEYMTQGCADERLLAKIVRPAVINPDTSEEVQPERSPRPGDILTVEEAATLVGMRYRNARMLIRSPIGERALSRAVQEMRCGAAAKAMKRIIDLVDDPGEGRAADRKVQLEASKALLGDQVGPSAPTISVTVNTQNNIQPGYVIRDPRPAMRIIEGED